MFFVLLLGLAADTAVSAVFFNLTRYQIGKLDIHSSNPKAEIIMSAFSEKAKLKHQRMSQYLRAVRKEKGHTMRTLSQKLGTPHSFIGKIENQDRRLDIAEFILYCEGLEKDPLELFGELLAQ